MTVVIDETVVLDRELSRFFQVSKELFDETGAMAMMPTCVVDEHWHDLIEEGKIDAFVAECLGDDVTVAHVEAGGVDPLNWVTRYEVMFGSLNPLWFTGQGGLNTELFNEYVGGKTPDMAWDCTPAFLPKEVKMAWDCTPAFAKKLPSSSD